MRRWVLGGIVAVMLALPMAGLAVDSPEAIGYVGLQAGDPLPDGAQAALSSALRPGETQGYSHDFTALGGSWLFVELSNAEGEKRLVGLERTDAGWQVTLQSAYFPVMNGIAADIAFWSRVEFAVTYDSASFYRQYRFQYEDTSPGQTQDSEPTQPRWMMTGYEVRDGFGQPERTDSRYVFETYANGVMCRGTREGYMDNLLANYFPFGLQRDAEVVYLGRLPVDRDTLAAALYDGEYAIVQNPVESERLHLRVAPQKGAESLGKFYNGTVVYILGYEGEWAHVSVGGCFEGYMMREYLAVGAERANATTFYYTYYATPYDIPALKEAGGGVISGWPDEEPGPMLLYARPEKVLFLAEVPFHSQVLLLGVYEDDWVIVEYEGTVGYAYAENVWEGNG